MEQSVREGPTSSGTSECGEAWAAERPHASERSDGPPQPEKAGSPRAQAQSPSDKGTAAGQARSSSTWDCRGDEANAVGRPVEIGLWQGLHGAPPAGAPGIRASQRDSAPAFARPWPTVQGAGAGASRLPKNNIGDRQSRTP